MEPHGPSPVSSDSPVPLTPGASTHAVHSPCAAGKVAMVDKPEPAGLRSRGEQDRRPRRSLLAVAGGAGPALDWGVPATGPSADRRAQASCVSPLPRSCAQVALAGAGDEPAPAPAVASAWFAPVRPESGARGASPLLRARPVHGEGSPAAHRLGAGTPPHHGSPRPAAVSAARRW